MVDSLSNLKAIKYSISLKMACLKIIRHVHGISLGIFYEPSNSRHYKKAMAFPPWPILKKQTLSLQPNLQPGGQCIVIIIGIDPVIEIELISIRMIIRPKGAENIGLTMGIVIGEVEIAGPLFVEFLL